jgi:serine/threonine-protein kinase
MSRPFDDFDSAVTSPSLKSGAAQHSAAAAERSLEPLQKRYELLEELGRGGMGVVYRARDLETGAVVALKVIQPQIAANAQIVEQFKSELLLARKVTHVNVCRVYDLNRLGDVVAISMEFVEGESLRHILRRYGPLSLKRGLDWARQICAGLAAAHAQGVVHRDLKPENILITSDGTVKVMDFGLAGTLDAAAKETGSISGTPAFMSPELAQGKPSDHRSDIYTLGLILYEMFCGRQAFEAPSVRELIKMRVQESPAPPQ